MPLAQLPHCATQIQMGPALSSSFAAVAFTKGSPVFFLRPPESEGSIPVCEHGDPKPDFQVKRPLATLVPTFLYGAIFFIDIDNLSPHIFRRSSACGFHREWWRLI